jgi:hypothetical protein
MENQGKECNKCGERKNIEEFHIDKGKKDGRRNECKECRKIHAKTFNANKKKITNNPEIVKKSNKNEEIKKIHEEIDSVFGNPETSPSVFEALGKKIENTYQKIMFQPTNKIKICISQISGGSSFKSSVEIIKSKLSLFLAIKRNKIDVDIKVCKSTNFQLDFNLIVELPPDILLSYEEVDEFKKSLLPQGKTLRNSVEIKTNDNNADDKIKEFLLSECGYEIEEIYTSRNYKEGKIIMSWPEECSITEKEIEELKKILD